jgi:hypothetical protein
MRRTIEFRPRVISGTAGARLVKPREEQFVLFVGLEGVRARNCSEDHPNK